MIATGGWEQAFTGKGYKGVFWDDCCVLYFDTGLYIWIYAFVKTQ